MDGQVVVVAPEGALGRDLVEDLIAAGRPPVVLADNPSEVLEHFPQTAGSLRFNGLTTGPWVDAFDGASVVLSLAGAFGRQGEAPHLLDQRRRMAGRLLADAVSSVRVAPRALVGVSSLRALELGPPRGGTTPLNETAPRGTDAAARAVAELERGIFAARQWGTRAVAVRMGLLLDRREGVVPLLQRRFAARVGGPVRPRAGWWPWIHVTDALGLLNFAADETRSIDGVLHAVAPIPVTSGQLAQAFGARLGRASWLAIPRRVARRRLGEDAVALLTRGPPVATRAGTLGYVFTHPTVESALDAALGAPAPQRASRQLEAHQT